MSDTPPAPSTTPAGRFSVGEWTGLVLGAAVLLGLLTARAPHELRKPLLLPLVVGGCVGAVAGELARRLKAAQAVPLTVVTVAAVAIALGVCAFESHRQLAAHTRAHPPEPAADLLGLDAAFRDWLDNPPEPGTEGAPDRQQLADALEIRRQREAQRTDAWQRRQTLLGYLQFRIPPAWGQWPPLLAGLFWLLEVGLAATLGAVIAHRLANATDLPATSREATAAGGITPQSAGAPVAQGSPTGTESFRSIPTTSSPLAMNAGHEPHFDAAGGAESGPQATPLAPAENHLSVRPAPTSRPTP